MFGGPLARRAALILADVARAGLDASDADPALLRRIRTFNLSTLTLVLFALPLCVLTLALERPGIAGLLAGLIALSAGNMQLLRRTRRPGLSGYIGTALLFAFLVLEAASSGGFYQPNFAWLYVIPVVAGTLIGARGCLIWVAVCVLTMLVFWLHAEAGFGPVLEMHAPQHAIVSLVSRLTAVMSLGVLVVGFTMAQRQLEVQLRARSKQQHEEARFAHLLYDAAKASNEASSSDQALRSSIELICRALGWPVAQAYSTSTQERHVLRATAIRFVEDEEQIAAFAALYSNGERAAADDLPLRPLLSRAPLWIEDVSREPGLARAELARRAGLGAAVLVPVQLGDGVTAVLEFFAREPLKRDSRLLGALEQIAAQVGHAVQRARARDQMRSLVFFDALTGLPNRRFFQERLAVAIDAADRSRSQLALFFLDLDGFKSVNDTLGHDVGDKLLSVVASRLSRIVRVSDCVARNGDGSVEDSKAGGAVSRLGGDEFTVLLANVPSRSVAAKVGRRLLGGFREPFRVGDRDIFTGASIGVALYPEDGADMTSLLRNADIAMYHAKERGRNNFQFFSAPLAKSGSRQLTLEGRLCRAVENEEFELYYQPVRHARLGQIVGAEALLRWNDSELGWVAPAEFIPVAEKCGQIGPLGSWVIRTAAAQARAWIDAGLRPIRISVNVSGHQVRHPKIVPTIRDALLRNRLEGTWFQLELTESTIMQDDEITNEILRELSDLGVSLALDDFGTGYSSLSYLRRLPISHVKIDRSFIADIPGSQEDCALVGAIIAMAHSLRIEVVAEGVESESQLEFLRERDCDEVQGYLFSPAVPAAELAQILQREKAEDEADG